VVRGETCGPGFDPRCVCWSVTNRLQERKRNDKVKEIIGYDQKKGGNLDETQKEVKRKYCKENGMETGKVIQEETITEKI
jgi:hypothetical protein